jgi:NAD(P)-dependent dehydrogenase (short-subunit alcohol dehydrogenase family)
MGTALVTSANRGIGHEFTRQYAAEGWHVFAACRHPDSAKNLQRLAVSKPVDILEMDVTNSESIKRAAAIVAGKPIDILINTAGIIGVPNQTAGNMDYESWAEVLNINTMGPLRVAEQFVENVARSTRKLIVTITSGMGSLADNTSGGSIAYRSSKAAVNMVMRSLAIDFAQRGVSCVLINPGWVRTDMGGPNAPLEPADSVKAMRQVIESLGPDDSGRFYNYDGREYAW